MVNLLCILLNVDVGAIIFARKKVSVVLLIPQLFTCVVCTYLQCVHIQQICKRQLQLTPACYGHGSNPAQLRIRYQSACTTQPGYELSTTEAFVITLLTALDENTGSSHEVGTRRA